MKQKQSEELRQHYIKHPPEGMTSDLVKHMIDSDLLERWSRRRILYRPFLSTYFLLYNPFYGIFSFTAHQMADFLIIWNSPSVQNNCWASAINLCRHQLIKSCSSLLSLLVYLTWRMSTKKQQTIFDWVNLAHHLYYILPCSKSR